MKKFFLLDVFIILTLILTSWFALSQPAPAIQTSLTTKNFAGAVDSVKLPVVMYHSVLENKKGKYVITPQQLENDIIAFKQAGFESVFPSEVISFVKNGTSLPEKPILLTFDDGHYNNFFYALPILQKHNFKALINIIGIFSQNSSNSKKASNVNYSHLTWEQIKALEDSGCFEIGNHTYNMHNFKERFGIKKLKNESDEAYIKNLTQDISSLQTILTQSGVKAPAVFAYPFGEYSPLARDTLLNNGFHMMLTCNEGITTIKKHHNECLHFVKRYNRSGLYSTQDILNRINN